MVRPSTVEEARADLACESCGELGLCDCGSEEPAGCEHCGEAFTCACESCGACRWLHGCRDCCEACAIEQVRYVRTWDGARSPDVEPHLVEALEHAVRWLVGDVLDVEPSPNERRARRIDYRRRREAARWGCSIAVARAARRAA